MFKSSTIFKQSIAEENLISSEFINIIIILSISSIWDSLFIIESNILYNSMKIKSLSGLKESVNSNASLVFWNFNKKSFNVSDLIETVFLPLLANWMKLNLSFSVETKYFWKYLIKTSLNSWPFSLSKILSLKQSVKILFNFLFLFISAELTLEVSFSFFKLDDNLLLSVILSDKVGVL